MAVILESTTEPQEEMNSAVGLPAGGAEEEHQEEEQQPGEGREGASESAAASGAAEETENEEEEEARPGKKPAKGGLQKRLDTITRRMHEYREEVEALQEQIRRKGDGGESGEKKVAAGPPPKPTQNDKNPDGSPKYATYEDFVEALTDWKTDRKLEARSQDEISQAEQERQQEVFRTYNDAAKSARVKYDDFDEVVGRKDLQIPQAAQLAIIEAGTIGPDIAYYLGTHPEICDELSEMTAMQAVKYIGRIEDMLTPKDGGKKPESKPNAGGNSSSTNNSPKPRAASAAPAPITPVGGAKTMTTVDRSKLTYQDWKRGRQSGSIR